MGAQPYPFSRWPRVTRAEASILGRALRRRPVGDATDAMDALAALVGEEVRLRPRLPAVVEPEEPAVATWAAAVLLEGPAPAGA
ncbi:MAG: hypothetical protein ACODAU_08250, partial [Myxococcota bacterium]